MPSLYEETQGRITQLHAGATIGIVGGGQLGRMMALSAKYMGMRVGVLDPHEDCPCSQVADFHILADYDNHDAIRELAERSDVLTYEFENVDADALDDVRNLVAIPQGTDLLRVTQDRIAEKTFINKHDIPTAPWKAVPSREALDEALREIGFPCVLKTTRGGYDGHGQIVLRTPDDLDRVWPADNFPEAILEGFVPFAFEASILVSGNGKDYVTFPIVHNIHRNNILHMTIARKNMELHIARAAHDIALRLAHGFTLAGTLAIELFVMSDGSLIVNELAPRPHNSGHYTIEACSFSQFDTHIRGILGWPLEQPRLLQSAIMVNVLGQHVAPVQELSVSHPSWHIHDYGKHDPKHDRKMGHVTILTDNIKETVREIEESGAWSDRSVDPNML